MNEEIFHDEILQIAKVNFLAKVQELHRAASNLLAAYGGPFNIASPDLSQEFTHNYPFAESFDEVVLGIGRWAADIEDEIGEGNPSPKLLTDWTSEGSNKYRLHSRGHGIADVIYVGGTDIAVMQTTFADDDRESLITVLAEFRAEVNRA